MGSRDLGALLQRASADAGQHHRLAPVAAVDLVAGGQGLPPLIGAVAGLLRQADHLRSTQPLGLAGVQKGLVVGAVGLHVRPLRLRRAVIAVFPLGKQLFLQLLVLTLFHGLFPP